MTCALEHIATNVVHCHGVFAAVVGRGVRKLHAHMAAARSTVIWWQSNLEHFEQFETASGDSIRLSELVGEEWPKFSMIQFLSNEEEVSLKTLANAEL